MTAEDDFMKTLPRRTQFKEMVMASRLQEIFPGREALSHKEKRHCVGLSMSIADHESIRAAAKSVGLKVSAYIRGLHKYAIGRDAHAE